MKHLVPFVLVMALADFSAAQEEPDGLSSRKQLWQKHLEHRKFRFNKDKLGMIRSMQRFSGNCQLHVIVNPRPRHGTTYSFVRDREELFSFKGDFEAVFRTIDEKLYHASFWTMAPGCTINAYDLTTGKKLWATGDISQLKQGGATVYSNQVKMRPSRLNGVHGEPANAVLIVTGHELFGDYIAIVDRETGVLLAHKTYGNSMREKNMLQQLSSPTSGGAFGGEKTEKPEPDRSVRP